MNEAKPVAFVLVPGAFCLPSLFEPLAQRLRSLGHPAHALALPSVGTDRSKSDGGQGEATAYDDTAYANRIATQYCDAGHDVILVGNSYGGFVITMAPWGLARSGRAAVGKSGAVVGLVYLASLLAPAGITSLQLLAPLMMGSIEAEPEEGYLSPPSAELTGEMWWSTISEEAKVKYGVMTDVMSAKTMHTSLRYCGYEHFPTTVVIPASDKTLPPEMQHERVRMAEERGVKVNKIVVPGDHIVMISSEDEVVRILTGLAQQSHS